MAFTRENNVTIEDVAGFEVRFTIANPASGEPDNGLLNVQLELSNSKFELRQYDLIARLNDDPTGQAYLANLVGLKGYIRTRLENEVLP